MNSTGSRPCMMYAVFNDYGKNFINEGAGVSKFVYFSDKMQKKMCPAAIAGVRFSALTGQIAYESARSTWAFSPSFISSCQPS